MRLVGLAITGPSPFTGRAEHVERPLRESFTDLGRFRVPMQHGITHLVDRARADRVVGGVPHDVQPRLVEERGGPAIDRLIERGEHLGALERALCTPPRPAARRRGST